MEVVLVIDIGNTNIKFAIYQGQKQLLFDKVNTKCKNDYNQIIDNLLAKTKIKPCKCVFVSVVPSVETEILNSLKLKSIQIFIINTKIKTNLILNDIVKNELGNDLLCMAAYGYYLYKKELIVLSLGTASAMIHIDGFGEIKHSLIFPGLKSGAKNLFESAEQLEEIDLDNHTDILALDTKNALKAGIIYAYVGSIKFIINQYKKLINDQLIVIASGGMSKLIKQYCNDIDYCDRDLIMKGALFLKELNDENNFS